MNIPVELNDNKVLNIGGVYHTGKEEVLISIDRRHGKGILIDSSNRINQKQLSYMWTTMTIKKEVPLYMVLKNVLFIPAGTILRLTDADALVIGYSEISEEKKEIILSQSVEITNENISKLNYLRYLIGEKYKTYEKFAIAMTTAYSFYFSNYNGNAIENYFEGILPYINVEECSADRQLCSVCYTPGLFVRKNTDEDYLDSLFSFLNDGSICELSKNIRTYSSEPKNPYGEFWNNILFPKI